MSKAMRRRDAAAIDSDADEDSEAINDRDASGSDGQSGDSLDDSSSEDSEDDEEDLEEVRRDFIVDEDEEEEESDRESRRARRRLKRASSKHIEELDEDDLDLVKEAAGIQTSEGSRFKRLKRAKASEGRSRKNLDNIFDDQDDDDEDGDEDSRRDSGHGRHRDGELDDFIEEDELSDGEALRRQEELETQTRTRPQKSRAGLSTLSEQISGLDGDKLSEIYEIFGDGEMYDWALEGEDELEAQGHGAATLNGDGEKPLDLADVFEPSELKARLLTAEDNAIRIVDLPERYQLMRGHLKHGYETDKSEYAEKKRWIVAKMIDEKRLLLTLQPELEEPIGSAVTTVVDLIALEGFEVPYIWHHRQDYLNLVKITQSEEGAEDTQSGPLSTKKLLLNQDDLWRIVELDMEFHHMLEKRKVTYDLWESLEITDSVDLQRFERFFEFARDIVEYQDVMDFIQFMHSEALKARLDTAVKRHHRFGHFDRIRQSTVYDFVQAVASPSPDDLVRILNFQKQASDFPQLVTKSPTELVQELVPEQNPELAISMAKEMISAELSYHPGVRKFLREEFKRQAKIDIVVTDDGKRKIDENSPFYDIKYACNWSFEDFSTRPDVYLRMLQAEQQGLVVVRIQFPNYKTTLLEQIMSAYVTNSDAEWSQFKRDVIKQVSKSVVPLISRNIRESLRFEAIKQLQAEIRKEFAKRVDQAPYKPTGFVFGTTPRVLALSAGMAEMNKDAVVGIVLDEDGKIIENVKFPDPGSPEFAKKLAQVVNLRNPDVIGLSGFSPQSRRILRLIERAIDEEDLKAGDQDEDKLQVKWVNDEVARIFRNSKRAAIEFTDLVPLAKYCVGLARYMQSPILEYAGLGSEISNIRFHEYQQLLPAENFDAAIESVFVDFVNLVGVDINMAVSNPSLASVVQYIAGLGPRKASGILQAIQKMGGTISNRTDLVTNELTSKTTWVNCASFLKIPQDSLVAKDDGYDPLDATRIHPEDYNLARKIAADALELDEEDVEALEANNAGGVVARLFSDDLDRLNELVLEDFATILDKEFRQKKLLTLEMIREELKDNYRELRHPLREMNDMEIFTMLTGETNDSLHKGSVVSGIVRKVSGRDLTLQLSCGIHAVAESGNISDDRSRPISSLFSQGQAVRALILQIDPKEMFAVVTTRNSDITEALEANKRQSHAQPDHWNFEAEQKDLDAVRMKVEGEMRRSRVIKHPLFKLFTSKQAEEYLATMQRGDLVVRPSSLGNDHITVTWKVSDMIYQHLDVLELEKPNEYSLGRILQVGRWQYSDLDELILMHVQAMARKVDEMERCDKFQSGTKADVDKWLTAYTNARPNQSVYAYCFDHKRAGYFLLCFKTGARAPVEQWHVKLIPNGYELFGNEYNDTAALSNGFKMLFQRRARQG